LKKRRFEYAESKSPRTRSWRSYPSFDAILAEESPSGLAFLKQLYEKEIRDFPNHFDLNDESNAKAYSEMKKRLSMIKEELTRRRMDENASPSFEKDYEYFDAETGYVIGEEGIKYAIAYSEDEDALIYDHTVVSGTSDDDFEPLSDSMYRKLVYKDWKYWNDIDN